MAEATHERQAEKLAQMFHETYERLAPEHGYKTREASAVPWEDVPAANKSLMIAVAARIYDAYMTTQLQQARAHAVDQRARAEAAEVERDALKAAIEQVLEMLDAMTCTPLGPPGTNDLFTVGRYEMADRVRALLPAALDTPGTATACTRCEGSRFEPGTEEEGDWDSAAMMHHPPTGEPCTACNGTGTATGWLDRLAAASLEAARAKFGPDFAPERPGTATDTEGDEVARRVDDALWRMFTLELWAYRDLSGDALHHVLSVMTNLWDILDPDRTRRPARPATDSPADATDTEGDGS